MIFMLNDSTFVQLNSNNIPCPPHDVAVHPDLQVWAEIELSHNE